ncbi:hypothetical protein, partial [Ectopseudomonas mendocina]|uniref:hypothetical protein n=1 Tax=Ectopseudomonas mendocina TaxID=300 RepID=UPI001C8F2ACA
MLLSQKLASYLITHSGNYRYNSTESALLTHREKEILNKLRIGASNNAGNVSSATTQTLLIDTTAPTTPAVTSPTLTNAPTPMLS